MFYRSGKSSIERVVFHKMSPNETLYLESTSKISRNDVISFIDFQIWDFPGQIDFFDSSFDLEIILERCGSLVFVIDAQDDYLDALNRIVDTVVIASKFNIKLSYEVFIHKVDGLSDDLKIEIQRDIHQRITEELMHENLEDIHMSFYLTSIYDHSIYEAFSKVIQKLIPQLPTLENLLNILCSNSNIEKAFLFDVMSKIYIATDSSPVDIQTYELCSDMIDVVIDISCIYGPKQENEENDNENASYGTDTYSVIHLANSMVLYLREVNEHLALVCFLREENFEKPGLLDYNFACFKKAIEEVFEVRRRLAQGMLPDSEDIPGNNKLNENSISNNIETASTINNLDINSTI
ncbi:ras-related GTP binding D [Neocallimastix californiae]|uniref:GTP-binding protein n=1 Tax=Neocallimastix californiae TaxID=1754190 RepID=A0A1Y2CXE3_9FUNG|nr:ras-related GTP binding D [Neocallimastix californiae]|eukprot:ORY51708.1 ras-related GTP binding D [Neocallimastix californiae]